MSELEKKRRREKDEDLTNPEEASMIHGEMNEIRMLQAKTLRLFLEEWSSGCMPNLRKERKTKWEKLRKAKEMNQTKTNLEDEYEEILK